MSEIAHRPSRLEFFVFVLMLIALGTLPLWTVGWWTALPFATAVGGIIGGRWLRWYWSLPFGFLAGAFAWSLELALVPADPRSRLAEVLGAAEGLSATVFLLLGPILFGLVAAIMAASLAGAIRLVHDPNPPSTARNPVPAGVTGPGGPT
jgi:hypothetical protein